MIAYPSGHSVCETVNEAQARDYCDIISTIKPETGY